MADALGLRLPLARQAHRITRFLVVQLLLLGRPPAGISFFVHQAGRLEEAEKIARQAVAIDPSDGEQGKNDRMRVYAVLAGKFGFGE